MKLVCTFFLLSLCLIFSLPLTALDLGVMGETYPIIEMDFLEFIQSRADIAMQNGMWKNLEQKAKQSALRYRDRPSPVTGISCTVQAKRWLFDPSIILDHDLFARGQLIAPKGTQINPLMTIKLSKVLIFYNGDDTAQVNWVLKQDSKLKGRDKLILVNGSLLNQEKLFQKKIYFDQAGKLTTRFGIKHVPALVQQEGMKLKMSEVKI